MKFVSIWIQVWLALSSIICLWDATFIFNRPDSMKGGTLSYIWQPYELYVTIDKLYGDLNDNFVYLQSVLNIFEIVLNVLALLFSFLDFKKQVLGGLLCIVTSCFTFWKTIIYFYYNQDQVSHNNITDLITLYIIPSGIWVVVPLAVIIRQLTLYSKYISEITKNGKQVKQKCN